MVKLHVSLFRCLHTSSNEGENEVKTGEKLISVDDVLAEVINLLWLFVQKSSSVAGEGSI